MAIRVLHLTSVFNRGGVETYLREVLTHLPREHVEFYFTHTRGIKGEMDDEYLESGARFIQVPERRNFLEYLRAFNGAIRENNIDIVHVHHPELQGYFLCAVRLMGAKARFVHVHNTYWDTTERGLRGAFYKTIGRRITLNGATCGIACSAMAAVYAFGKDWRCDRRFKVIHYGITLERFEEEHDRDQVRRELGIPADAMVVGHIGSFTAQKNHVKLLEIAEALFAGNKRACLLLVGDGELRPEVEELAREKGIAGRVVFAGVRDDVPRLLTAFDVFLLPSLFEGLPIALIEAQAAGVPCVVSRVITEEAGIVKDCYAVLGLDDSAPKWAGACERLAAKRDWKSSRGLEIVSKSDFNIEVSTNKLIREYESAL
jgi:glycosyltransferase involved in cell wall biosynthesis